jgi:Uma2 family endonuclease
VLPSAVQNCLASLPSLRHSPDMVIPEELLFTREDYRATPEGPPYYQLVEGDLIMSATPNRSHQEISGNLEFILRSFVKSNKAGKIYDAPFDVYLDEINVFQPDIIFVSNERLSIFNDAGADGAPDLVIEILSPSNTPLDRDKKRKIYARCGVTEMWLVSPESKTVSVYRLQEDATKPVAIRGEHETVATPLLPGLTVELREVFVA